MSEGDQIKYGIVKGYACPYLSIPVGASEVIPAGGAFVLNDGSGRAEIAVDGSTLLAGYIFPSDVGLDDGQTYETTNSTEGSPVVPFIEASAMIGIVVRLPISGGTYVATMLGKTADLEVNSASMQSVQLDASAEDTVIVVGGDLVNNRWVDVTINPDKITGLTGVV